MDSTSPTGQQHRTEKQQTPNRSALWCVCLPHLTLAKCLVPPFTTGGDGPADQLHSVVPGDLSYTMVYCTLIAYITSLLLLCMDTQKYIPMLGVTILGDIFAPLMVKVRGSFVDLPDELTTPMIVSSP